MYSHRLFVHFERRQQNSLVAFLHDVDEIVDNLSILLPSPDATTLFFVIYCTRNSLNQMCNKGFSRCDCEIMAQSGSFISAVFSFYGLCVLYNSRIAMHISVKNNNKTNTFISLEIL